jgi:hypothetical protein
MMNKPSSTLLFSVAVLALSLTACGQPPTAPPAATQTEAQAAPAPQVAAPQVAAPLARSQSPEGAAVSILSPRSGDIVSSPVKVVFDVQGMTLLPAGDPTPNSGHHHLLVDVPAPDLGQPVPKDAQHLHFGQAQTEVEITLPPGPHTLQLLLGDSNHVPHNPPLLSAPITITVQ